MAVKLWLLGLLASAKDIKKQEGTIGLLGAFLRFAIGPAYKSESFYLYEYRVRPEYGISEGHARVRHDRLDFKLVKSNQEADRLEAEGFAFRSYPTNFNYGLKLYRRWLDCGAAACCVFVDKEFAAVNWVLTSDHTQRLVKAPPVKVDYLNHEAFPRGAWVNAKFRGMELYRYAVHMRDQAFLKKGVTVMRYTIDYKNAVGKGLHDALGAEVYGRGRLTTILGLRVWRESRSAEPR